MFSSSPEIRTPNQLTSPPASPRTRRRSLRDSDVTKGEQTLEEYLLACDPCRCTSVTPPLSYPLAMRNCTELADAIQPLRPEIYGLLKSHQFSSSAVLQTLKVSKPDYPGGEAPVSLLRVSLRNTDNAPLCWNPAKEDLLKLLTNNNLFHVEVEILNEDSYHKEGLFYLLNTHPLALAFQHAKAGLISILDEAIRNRWGMLCPFNVGRTEGKAQPAIAVIVNPLTVADWATLRAEMIALVAPHCSNGFIHVEFLPGKLSFL
ncbi:hypothetical protein N7486_009877 [Penicillium sp. IBT 16267x]|nr:hypothetical protein N7486_009877 [Penicillium sp. IBT 16267x]